jgi:hypothetical protein
VALLLTACQVGPDLRPSPAPTVASPSPAAADVAGAQRTAEVLFPEGGRTCGAAGPDYSACPISAPLKARLKAGPVPYVDQLSRSADAYTSRTFTVTATTDGALVAVEVALPSSIQKLDLAFERAGADWLLADITCTGRGTSTSLFSSSPTQCYATR